MDYYRILNLSSEPFSNSPDPDFFFQSVQHMECLQNLEISLRVKRGLNVVIGDVGAGKTTLSRLLIRKFSEDRTVDIYLILDPEFKSPLDFLKTVSETIGAEIPDDTNDLLKYKETIKQELYKRGVDQNRTTVFIVDEGQKIPLDCLEILREFLNYETNEFKLLQIVIFAQREFVETVDSLDNFRDRINFYYELGSLNYEETKGLVQYRLDQASRKSESKSFFSFSGFWAIYLLTGGFPRKIINLCHRSLLAMIIQNRSTAGWSLVTSCADREGKKRLFSKTFIPALCVLVVFVMGTLFSTQAFHFNKKQNLSQVKVSKEHFKEIREDALSLSLKQQKKPTQAVIAQSKRPTKKVINGIIEEELLEEQELYSRPNVKNNESQRVSQNKQKRELFLSSSTVTNKQGNAVTQGGIRIVSGPGATILVRKLIPEKTNQ